MLGLARRMRFLGTAIGPGAAAGRWERALFGAGRRLFGAGRRLFGGGRRLFEVLPSRVELEIVRVIGTPDTTYIRYRVRRCALTRLNTASTGAPCQG